MPPKTLKPFITPVNSAGLPIAWQTLPYDGRENCMDIRPQTLAKLYWLTESIHIHYHLTYSYKDVVNVYQGSLHLTCPSLPHERIKTPPVFIYESTMDDSFRAFAQLDLYNVNHREPFQNLYGFCFEFYFENTREWYTLAFSNKFKDYTPVRYLKDTRSVLFMQHAFPANLYTSFPDAEASIKDFQVTPHFYKYT